MRALLPALLALQTWTVGSRVHANAVVCARADTAQTTCGTLRILGDKGTLVQGPAGSTTGYGLSWFVRYDTPPAGWSTAKYLTLDSLAPADTVNRSWTLGLRVRTTGTAVYVRADSTCCSQIAESLGVGIKGTLVGGPWKATDNGVRWRVAWDGHTTGWSRQELMTRDSTAPPPPPTPVATTVTVTPPSLVGVVGQSARLVATVRDQNGAVMTAPITWASRTPAIATVDATGLVLGVAPGVDTVTATSGAARGQVLVTVQAVPPPPPPPSGTPVLPRVTALKNLAPSVGFTLGLSAALSAIPVDSAGDLLGNIVTWTIADSSIVQVRPFVTGVSQGVQVTGRAPGTTTITASVGTVRAATVVNISAPDTTVISWSVGGLQVPSLPSLRHFTFPIALTLYNRPCYVLNFTAPGVDSVVATTTACMRVP